MGFRLCAARREEDARERERDDKRLKKRKKKRSKRIYKNKGRAEKNMSARVRGRKQNCIYIKMTKGE